MIAAVDAGSILRWSRLIGLVLALATTATTATTAATAQSRDALIIKLRGAGPHAVNECAEELFRRGRSFASASADGSESLDRLHDRLRVRAVKALFRERSGGSLAEDRALLRQRLERKIKPPRSGRGRRAAGDRIPDLSHVYRVEIEEGQSVDEALALYRADAHVEYAQRDHHHATDGLPNDPFLYTSGSWRQTFEDLWALYRIRAPEAWGITRGAGVVVAVVDTGVDYEHPDIAGNMWINPGEDLDGNGIVDDSDWNGVDDDGNGFIDDLHGFDFANSEDTNEDGDYLDPEDVSDPDPVDDNGHGTHIAGTIAAIADNGIGIAGVAPEARIMALKGFLASGDALDSKLWRAVLYAAENGAHVINTSWSCSPLCPENPLAEEIVALVHAMDVVIVTSAGNRQTDVVYNSPENQRETITVASSGEDDRPSASFTNYGWLVDVAAPGGGPSADRNVRFASS